MSKKINPKSIIKESSTSIYIFSFPIFSVIGSLIYVLNNSLNFQLSQITIVLIFNLIVFSFSFIHYNKKIILTRNHVIVYHFKKEVLFWSLVDNFSLIDIKTSVFGKLFNFGNLILVNKDKMFFDFIFLKNHIDFRNSIIYRYERNMKKLDPSFVGTVSNLNEKNIDKLED